jgi:hypothetical protein
MTSCDGDLTIPRVSYLDAREMIVKGRRAAALLLYVAYTRDQPTAGRAIALAEAEAVWF